MLAPSGQNVSAERTTLPKVGRRVENDRVALVKLAAGHFTKLIGGRA